MIINVGSLNRVKRGAVEEVCRELFGDVTIRHYGVDSGVAHTPSTDEEILRGAARRAEGAFRASRADLGIGLEGGIAPGPYGPLLKGWVAVFDGTDTTSCVSSASRSEFLPKMLMPEPVSSGPIPQVSHIKASS